MCGFRFILQLDIIYSILYSIYYIQYLHTICYIIIMYWILYYIYAFSILYVIYITYDVPYNTYYKLDGYVLCNI